jgi:hypothetical protein
VKSLSAPTPSKDTDMVETLATFHQEWLTTYADLVRRRAVMSLPFFMTLNGANNVYRFLEENAKQKQAVPDDAALGQWLEDIAFHNDTQLRGAFADAIAMPEISAVLSTAATVWQRAIVPAELLGQVGFRQFVAEFLRRRNAAMLAAVQSMLGQLDAAFLALQSRQTMNARAMASGPRDVAMAVSDSFARFWDAWGMCMSGDYNANTDILCVRFEHRPQDDILGSEAFAEGFPHNMMQYPTRPKGSRGIPLAQAIAPHGTLGAEDSRTVLQATPADVAGQLHQRIRDAFRAAHLDTAAGYNLQQAFDILKQALLLSLACVQLRSINFNGIRQSSGHKGKQSKRDNTGDAIHLAVGQINRAFYTRAFQYIKAALLAFMTRGIDCSLYTARTVSEKTGASRGAAVAEAIVPVLLRHETSLSIFRGLLVTACELWLDEIVADMRRGLDLVAEQFERMAASATWTPVALSRAFPSASWMGERLRSVCREGNSAQAAAARTVAPALTAAAGGAAAQSRNAPATAPTSNAAAPTTTAAGGVAATTNAPAARPSSIATRTTLHGSHDLPDTFLDGVDATDAMCRLMFLVSFDYPVEERFANKERTNRPTWEAEVFQMANGCHTALHVFMLGHIERVLAANVYPRLQATKGEGSLYNRLLHHVSHCVVDMRYHAVDAPLDHDECKVLAVQEMEPDELTRYLEKAYCWDTLRGPSVSLDEQLRRAMAVLRGSFTANATASSQGSQGQRSASGAAPLAASVALAAAPAAASGATPAAASAAAPTAAAATPAVAAST